MSISRTRRLVAGAATGLLSVALVGVAAPLPASAATDATAAEVCTRYAAPNGSDSGSGTATSPYRTATKLAASLGAGQIGCLATGTYTGDVKVSSDGATLRSTPGQRATLQVGTLTVPDGAEDVTISDLNIVGRADVLTTRLTGDRFRFLRNDVTNNNQGRDQIGSCILVAESGAMTSGGLISGNKIHNCGPIGSNFGHGIYTQNVGPASSGQPGLTIENNVIYGFGSYAIQLYPKAHGVIVRRNVIDGGVKSIRGGIVIDGDSTGHRIEQNVIAWTQTGAVVQRVGSGHVSSNNCFWQNPSDVSGSSIARSGDVNADPKFLNRGAGDYRMAAGSTCLTKMGVDPAALFLAGGQATTAPRPAAPKVTVRGITKACPPGFVPADAFADDNGTVHEGAINCVLTWKVASGTSSTTFEPAATVTRGQMASFLARLIERSGGTLPAGKDAFSDDEGSVHEDSINRLAAAGLVQGPGGGRFAPDQPVSRAAMASFLMRAFEYRSGPVKATQNWFFDDDGDTHEAAINSAASAGFAAGVGDGFFEPKRPVQRGQMASFLARALDRLVADGVTSAS